MQNNQVSVNQTSRYFKVGKEAHKRFVERHIKEQVASRADLIKRMLERYHAETDREYAEVMWGDSLRRYGAI